MRILKLEITLVTEDKFNQCNMVYVKHVKNVFN